MTDKGPDPAASPDPDHGPPLDENAPAVVVLRMLRRLITEARGDAAVRQSADVDLRVLNEIHQKLAQNSAEPGAVQWLRQLTLSWNSKLRGSHVLKFRRIFDLLDAAAARR